MDVIKRLVKTLKTLDFDHARTRRVISFCRQNKAKNNKFCVFDLIPILETYDHDSGRIDAIIQLMDVAILPSTETSANKFIKSFLKKFDFDSNRNDALSIMTPYMNESFEFADFDGCFDFDSGYIKALDIMDTLSFIPSPEQNCSSASDDKDSCVICLDHRRTLLLTACGHFCICPCCYEKVSECPICRKKKTGFTVVFDV